MAQQCARTAYYFHYTGCVSRWQNLTFFLRYFWEWISVFGKITGNQPIYVPSSCTFPIPRGPGVITPSLSFFPRIPPYPQSGGEIDSTGYGRGRCKEGVLPQRRMGLQAVERRYALVRENPLLRKRNLQSARDGKVPEKQNKEDKMH